METYKFKQVEIKKDSVFPIVLFDIYHRYTVINDYSEWVYMPHQNIYRLATLEEKQALIK